MIIDFIIIGVIVFGLLMCWAVKNYIVDLKRGDDKKFWVLEGTIVYIIVSIEIAVGLGLFWLLYVTESSNYEKVIEYEIQSHAERRGDHFVTDLEGEEKRVYNSDKDCDIIKYKYTSDKPKVVIKQNEYKGLHGCKDIIIYTND